MPTLSSSFFSYTDHARYAEAMSLEDSPLVTQARHRDYLESAVRHLEDFKLYRKSLPYWRPCFLINHFVQHHPKLISLPNLCGMPHGRLGPFLDPMSAQRKCWVLFSVPFV